MLFWSHAMPRPTDSTRPLSEPGKEASARLAGAAAARGVSAELFWHSGKLRARQTAELFQQACNPHAALSAARGLQPMDPPGLLLDQLLEEKRSIVLVGHMPHLARLLRALCGEPPGRGNDFPLQDV